MKKMVLSMFLWSCFFSQSIQSAYIQQPPSGWECINEVEQLPKKILEIFVGKANVTHHFTPSLNVAHESTSFAIHQYVLNAKSYHETQNGTRCTLLGTMQTASGPVQLLQIDRPSQWGPMRFVQAMLIDQGDAYVITATCLKNDFGILSPLFFKAMQSFNLNQSQISKK